ncbi:MAG: cysteine protease StiP family protein [Blautia sp.]|nr:cysteine protease StiP family protein [Blautia sp.]
MRSTYSKDDVEILLKDITGMVEPLPAEVRERYIQKGVHYCEMLPLEYTPSEKYMYAYEEAVKNYSEATAAAVSVLAEKIYKKKGTDLVIVSLARAGIPIGILLKRYLRNKYKIEVPHYAISIIRGRGIDKNALDYIEARHPAEGIQIVDGWIGKGAILTQLEKALADYPEIDKELGVVSDPAGLTELCGTHDDILIPSSCLNATVTGLISRTFLRKDIIGEDDFHGAACYGELEGKDLSEAFLRSIEKYFTYREAGEEAQKDKNIACSEIIRGIAAEYQVEDINFIKPGIGEATRVLLRRIPWKVLINPQYKDADELAHIYQLASEKGVPCEISKAEMGNYKVCGIIKRLSDV